MNPPGTPSHRMPDGHDDDHHLKDWMLSLVDDSPDHLAWIAVPHPGTEEKLDALDERLVRVTDLAKQERPDLGMKLLPAAYVGENAGVTAIALVLHEHEWVGGGCIRGCGETREAA